MSTNTGGQASHELFIAVRKHLLEVTIRPNTSRAAFKTISVRFTENRLLHVYLASILRTATFRS